MNFQEKKSKQPLTPPLHPCFGSDLYAALLSHPSVSSSPVRAGATDRSPKLGQWAPGSRLTFKKSKLLSPINLIKLSPVCQNLAPGSGTTFKTAQPLIGPKSIHVGDRVYQRLGPAISVIGLPELVSRKHGNSWLLLSSPYNLLTFFTVFRFQNNPA